MNFDISPKNLFAICVIFLSKVLSSSSHNILFYHTMATSSHRTAIWPLAEALADRGHNVTYIFPMDKKFGHHPRIREITPSKVVPILRGFVSEFDINIRIENKVNEWLETVFKATFDVCSAFFESPEIQEWLAESVQYDLILIDGMGECAYGLVYRFKAKHIIFSPLMIPFHQDAFGIVPESSSIPEILFHAKPTEMNFFNRMKTTFIPLLWRYKYLQYMEQIDPVIRQKSNASDMPPLTEIEQNASLYMINYHFVDDYSMALHPNFVSYSGLWCSKAKLKTRKPLPLEMEKFVEKGDGFFYISFGSAVVVSTMPKWMREHFFNAFRAFPQHRFLWRWTGPVPEDTPSNVMLLPWFPQHDILAHPKLIAFMTQTGKPSTQEALCHGVPLITMPVFVDQDYNADRLDYIGATMNLDIANISSNILQHSFQEIRDNPKYRLKMKELSAIFRDRPIDPLDNVLYWTEFVMRHNTTIMKPLSMQQTWWQRRLLDVYAAFFLISIGLVGTLSIVVFIFIRFVVKLVLRVHKKKKTE